jgi:quercetin dioxygenase-like cupin family protein
LRLLRSKKWVVLGVVAAAAIGVGVAVATVTSTVLSDTHPTGGSANEVRLRVVRFEFVPSPDQRTFSSGWHTHPGPVIFQVQEGRVRITQGPPCRTTTLGPGETYIEIPEHPVLATTSRPAKWTTSFILQASDPLSSPASDPCAAGDDGEDGDDD